MDQTPITSPNATVPLAVGFFFIGIILTYNIYPNKAITIGVVAGVCGWFIGAAVELSTPATR